MWGQPPSAVRRPGSIGPLSCRDGWYRGMILEWNFPPDPLPQSRSDGIH
jgi:hypothetical protein